MKRQLILLLTFVTVMSGVVTTRGQGQQNPPTNVPTLMYAQFINLSESHIIQHELESDTTELVYVLRYPGEVESLLVSPRLGLYYMINNRLYLPEGEDFVLQWSLPATDTVNDLLALAANSAAFSGLKGDLIVNDIVLSSDEAFLAYDLTTIDPAGHIGDEFIIIYERTVNQLRLIEIEARDLNNIHSVGNLRWSPDGTILAYAYPTQSSLDTEHITMVTGCTVDVTVECVITRQKLADEMPFMRTFDWSPDGTRIAYSCSDDHLASHQICVINRDGSGLVEYPTLETYKFDMQWSPDGRMLVYAAYPPDNQEQDIYLLNLETGTEINLSASPGVLDGTPFWWPINE